MTKKKSILYFCLAIFAALSLGSGAKAEGNRTYGLEMEKIIVATSPGYKPFEFEENGELKGYDVDIWKEFEKRTGIKVQWEFTDFSGLLGLLQSGRADVVAAQLSPTESRKASFLFSDPVSYYGSTVVVSAENNEIKSVKDLSGKIVGTGAGNNMHHTVQAMYPQGDVTFETYTSATLEAMFADLMFGRIDAVLAQDIQTYMAIQSNPNLKLKVLDPFEYSTGCLVMNKKNTALAKAVGEFLQDLKSDGTLKGISEKWIGEDISIAK